MSDYGITAVRLDQDGWVETALIGEITRDCHDFVMGSVDEQEANAIATMIKHGDEVYCIFGDVNERGPKFEAAVIPYGREGIKLVDDLPKRGLQQLIQLEPLYQEPNEPLGSW